MAVCGRSLKRRARDCSSSRGLGLVGGELGAPCAVLSEGVSESDLVRAGSTDDELWRGMGLSKWVDGRSIRGSARVLGMEVLLLLVVLKVVELGFDGPAYL